MKKFLFISFYLIVVSFSVNAQNIIFPQGISGLSLWLKADSNIITNGNNVTQWNDCSGNGYNAIQSNSTYQPQLTSNVYFFNNMPSVRFDGIDDFMRINPFVMQQPLTVFVVWSKGSVNDFKFCFDGIDATNRLFINYAPAFGVNMGSANAPALVTYPSGASFPPTITSAIYDNANSSIYVYGLQWASGNMGTSALTGITLGATYDAPATNNYYLDGDIAEFIIYNRVLTASERHQVEIYLFNKYICLAPQTSAISGNSSVCANQIDTFSVVNTPGSWYSWNISPVSAGTIDPATQGTNNIIINWDAVGYNATISVIENNGCTTGAPVLFNVTSNPIAPLLISGATSVPINATGTVYSVIDLGYQYTWTISGGISDPNPASGQGTDSITVNWHGIQGIGSVSVIATDLSCGYSSPPITQNVTITQTLNLGADTNVYSLCDTITLDAGSGYVSYNWSTGATTQTIDVNSYSLGNPNGFYAVTVTNVFGITSTDTILVTYPSFTLNTSNTAICLGDSISITTNPIANGYNYLWSNGSTSDTITVNQQGVYWASITTTTGCPIAAYTDTVTITVDSFASYVTLGNDTAFCSGNAIGIQPTNYIIQNYLWSDGSSNSTLVINNTGSYWVSVSDINGCFKVDTINVTISGNAPNSLFVADTVCLGNGTTFTNLSYCSNCNISYLYWNYGDTTPIDTLSLNPTHLYSIAGSYIVSLTTTTNTGCSQTFIDTIIVYPLPLPNFTISGACINNPYQFINISNFSAGDSIFWDFGDGTTDTAFNPIHTYSISGAFIVSLTIKNIKGCMSTKIDTISVIICNGNITGNFTYDNVAQTPLDSVWVYLMLNGSKVDSIQADTNGYYHFSNVPNGAYNITATTHKAWGGVNVTDAVLVKKHFAGSQLLTSSIRLHAADVNLTYAINVTDAVKIMRRFSGADTSFVRGDWVFEKPIGGDTINVSTYMNDTVIVNGANVVQNFKGLCVGDVNGSYNSIPIGQKSLMRKVRSVILEVRSKRNEKLKVKSEKLKKSKPFNCLLVVSCKKEK